VSDFQAVSEVSVFRLLDEGDILEGYLDGVSGSAAPGSDRSRSYWHGWCNGRVDASLAEQDAAQQALAAAFSELDKTMESTLRS